jgi:transcriptional regulator with XRE-family HTH domain
VVIGDRLRELREEKKLSQGHIEKRTGLLRCYISRVENGHTVPAIETLEKLARALEVPMYKLFYDGEKPAQASPDVFKQKSSDDGLWGNSGKDAKFLSELRRLMSKGNEKDRKLILYTLQKMSRLRFTVFLCRYRCTMPCLALAAQDPPILFLISPTQFGIDIEKATISVASL